jgi:hypothetical protein
MNSNAPLKAVLVFISALVPALLAEEVSPRMADSPEAQRIRDLTLIGRSVFASSPTELPAAKKVTILHLLSVQLQSRVDAIPKPDISVVEPMIVLPSFDTKIEEPNQ